MVLTEVRIQLALDSGSRICPRHLALQCTKRLQEQLENLGSGYSLAWRKGGGTKEIARERINILLTQAQTAFSRDQHLAKRYLELARKIGMKAGVRLTKEQRLRICRGCGGLLVPGVNCRVRTRAEYGTTVLITCLDCGTKKRYATVRERLSKRND